IQEWLAERSTDLRDRGIACMRITQPKADGSIALHDATTRGATSAFVARDVKSRPLVTKRICEALEASAAHAKTLVVASESDEVLFNSFGRRDALRHLDALARTHTLRIAYYVRPQDAWLESAWLQWGFRHQAPPDEWIRKQRSRIDYLDTARVVRDVAPNCSF